MRPKFAQGGVIHPRPEDDSVPVLLDRGCHLPAVAVEKLGTRNLLKLVNDGEILLEES